MVHDVPLQGRPLAQRKLRRGAATVEFAMTAPILFALVLGAVEFSRANMLVHTTSIAATEAARRSIVPGATVNEVRLKALDELENVGVVDASVEVLPATLTEDTTQVTVNLTVPVSLRNGYGISRVFLGKQVFKTVTLQREGKTEDVATETTRYDGIQLAAGFSNSNNSGSASSGSSSSDSNNGNSSNSNGNSGSNNAGSGNGNGNNGNGNGNGGGNGSNGNGGGNGNSNSGSSSSGSSGSGNSGSGNSGNSGSNNSGGFWGALRRMLGL
jgi:Flp pilus assembly protein TadG